MALTGQPLTVEHRRSLRLAACDATQRCADALTHLQREAGGSAVYLNEPLQRIIRDGQVAATHAMVAPRIHELTGRLRFWSPNRHHVSLKTWTFHFPPIAILAASKFAGGSMLTPPPHDKISLRPAS